MQKLGHIFVLSPHRAQPPPLYTVNSLNLLKEQQTSKMSKHVVWSCPTCNKPVPSSQKDIHIMGKKHKKKLGEAVKVKFKEKFGEAAKVQADACAANSRDYIKHVWKCLTRLPKREQLLSTLCTSIPKPVGLGAPGQFLLARGFIVEDRIINSKTQQWIRLPKGKTFEQFASTKLTEPERDTSPGVARVVSSTPGAPVSTLEQLLKNEGPTIPTDHNHNAAPITTLDLSVTDHLKISEYFHKIKPDDDDENRRQNTLICGENIRYVQSGLFGSSNESNEQIYLNVSEPFCLIATGVQGSGKSHTVGVTLENCILPFPYGDPHIVNLNTPMAALLFHYDQSENNFCEATGMAGWTKKLKEVFNVSSGISVGTEESLTESFAMEAPEEFSEVPLPDLRRAVSVFNENPLSSKIVVLVSPTNYTLRKTFYASESYEVLPLLFRWNDLDAVQLKKLMRINESDNQLYVGVMLGLLRQYQRVGALPEFNTFMKEITEQKDFSPGQIAPLNQRLMLLRQFISESTENKILQGQQKNLKDLVASGKLVVADMTDPMLSPAEANGIFQVLLEQFRKIPRSDCKCGKVVVCDEAHKYFDGKLKGGDGLSGAIVDTVRLMRHEGIRVIVSTQSPLTMPQELLELSTVAVCHQFHSMEWYKYLANKLPLPPDGFKTVQKLQPGQALVYAARSDFDHKNNIHGDDESEDDREGNEPFLVQVRPRLTEDRGASKQD